MENGSHKEEGKKKEISGLASANDCAELKCDLHSWVGYFYILS